LQFLLDGAAVFWAVGIRLFRGEPELFAEGGDFGFETVDDGAQFGFIKDFGDLGAGLDCSGALGILSPKSAKAPMDRIRGGKGEIPERC